MIEIGKINSLCIKEKFAFGFYLDGENLGEIMLLNKQAKEGVAIGDMVDVFVYMDSDDKLLATQKRPRALVGDFAYLKVISVSRVGAFLDLGISKDLLVRSTEQRETMQEGSSYVVHVFHESEGLRIAASSKLDHFFNPEISHYEEGEMVKVLVWEETELGYKVVINNTDLGLLYKSEIFQSIKIGQKISAFIKKIREDMKIDLILQKPGYEKSDSLAEKIVTRLKENNNFLTINDKSDAAEISSMFSVSKKKFKMAIGGLYKKQIIDISKEGIRLLTK